MAFLDNSGDIILDAVLTDTGRLRLAQGDGSFKIAKFALGDDEINYGLYNKSHPSGSAYFDLEILQTPVLEAFTNNSAQVKSRLMTISRTNILYMPVLKLNPITNQAVVTSENGRVQRGTSALFKRTPTSSNAVDDSAKSDARFYVAVDDDTFRAITQERRATNSALPADSRRLGGGNSGEIFGVLQGYQTSDTTVSPSYMMIRVDQGLDTNQIAAAVGMDSDLLETAFMVEMDYRLGRVKVSKGDSNSVAPVNFIDDDNIATYYLTSNDYVNGYTAPYEETRTSSKALNGEDFSNAPAEINPQVFEGPRGSTLHFRLEASAELQHSTYLFEQLGEQSSATATNNIIGFGDSTKVDQLINGKTIYYIDSTVRVVGANTGFRLDVPVRYVKIQ